MRGLHARREVASTDNVFTNLYTGILCLLGALIEFIVRLEGAVIAGGHEAVELSLAIGSLDGDEGHEHILVSRRRAGRVHALILLEDVDEEPIIQMSGLVSTAVVNICEMVLLTRALQECLPCSW